MNTQSIIFLLGIILVLVMNMIFAVVFMLILYYIFERIFMIIFKQVYKTKINMILDHIQTKEDLLYLRENDFRGVIALAFKRNGNQVEFTDKCGEGRCGLLVNGIIFVEMWKHSVTHLVEVESAMKFSKCMYDESIYRGKLITLGDFKTNTRLYCFKNVIECINGNDLLDLCRNAQRKSKIEEIENNVLSSSLKE